MSQHVKHEPPTRTAHTAIHDGWLHGSTFLSSILAGMLLGYLADQWLGTDPWLVVTGIILGSYSGFMRMWHYAKRMDDDPRAR